MDNVSFHGNQAVKDCIIRNGHSYMYLPPYSPFLNSIENMFSKWKEYIRQEEPQDETHLLELISTGANLITYNDCQEFYRHMFSYLTRCLNNEVIED
ncbi:hypothetical protein ENBRE01_3459 [Enteropsectra breve]|nr:hypothetical protein ENBRE01_3459 [Enteropsectra breve]